MNKFIIFLFLTVSIFNNTYNILMNTFSTCYEKFSNGDNYETTISELREGLNYLLTDEDKSELPDNIIELSVNACENAFILYNSNVEYDIAIDLYKDKLLEKLNNIKYREEI